MGLRTYLDLTKFGIVIFVLLTGIAGYAAGFQTEQTFSLAHFLSFIVGLYFLSSGSLALNQVQEWKLDQKMPRTAKRPIPSGKIKPLAGFILAVFFIFAGAYKLFECSTAAGYVGLFSVLFYNGIYTSLLKPKWIFAAVPGAIPGALPVTIGYGAINSELLSSESIYLFAILFLWQMPHFWSLAIRFKEDYRLGGIPTLPVSLGTEKAIYHIGLYTFVYSGFAIAAPWFIHSSWVYLVAVVPVALMLIKTFFTYQSSHGEKGWFPFFMWVNSSLLVFLFVPVIDKFWLLYQAMK